CGNSSRLYFLRKVPNFETSTGLLDLKTKLSGTPSIQFFLYSFLSLEEVGFTCGMVRNFFKINGFPRVPTLVCSKITGKPASIYNKQLTSSRSGLRRTNNVPLKIISSILLANK